MRKRKRRKSLGKDKNIKGISVAKVFIKNAYLNFLYNFLSSSFGSRGEVLTKQSPFYSILRYLYFESQIGVVFVGVSEMFFTHTHIK